MNRIKGQWALITGASAGIGEACARRLAAEDVHLVLWSRRIDRLETLKRELTRDTLSVRIAAVDVRDREGVGRAARELEGAGVAIDILVNNAGLASGKALIQKGDADDWDRMIDTNVRGLLNVTRAILPGMVARNRGHVVNIGSSSGRWVNLSDGVYHATKFAVRALNEAMSIDTVGTNVRISAVNPGFVKTEFSVVRFQGDRERADAVYDGFQPLTGDDIADIIYWILNAPPHVNIFDTYVLPTAQRTGVVLQRDQA
jgi:3-hydroxy acid dehydrogenase / malonic semialdehyde reductase